MDDEAPHSDPEVCKNALATAYIGRRSMSVLGKLESAARELEAFAVDCDSQHLRVARAELARAIGLIIGGSR